MKLLVIDDSESDYELTRSVLEDFFSPCDIVHRTTADEGIAEAMQSDYDIIFCDVVMPGKWGYDACREITKSKPYQDIYILTGSLEGLDSTIAREAGAKELICKGLEMKHLREVLFKERHKYDKIK